MSMFQSWFDKFTRRAVRVAALTVALAACAAISAGAAARDDLPYRPLVPGSFNAILLPSRVASDPGLQLAAEDLAMAFAELHGVAPKVLSDKGILFRMDLEGGDGYVVVGCDNGELNEPAAGVMLPETALGEESFSIAAQKGNRRVIVVRGGSLKGCIYGVARLTERIMINPAEESTINIEESPAFALRIVSGEAAEKAMLTGYNMRVASVPHNEAVLLDTVVPDIFRHSSHLRRDVKGTRAKLQNEAALDKHMHLDTASLSDEFEYNRALLKKPEGRRVVEANGSICSCNEDAWKLFAGKYEELAATAPGVEAFMVNTGSKPADSGFFGSPAVPAEPPKECGRCSVRDYPDRMADFIGRARDAISARPGDKKIYIHRTWADTPGLFNNNPSVYSEIISKLDNTANLYLSIKYTKSDFTRYSFPNETIGQAGPPQIVEFQCQRHNEGKGAFPNFIGEEYAEAYRMARDSNAAGVWNWNHGGGGTGGPFIKTDIWNSANAYAVSHLAWDPSASPATLARDWAALTFGAGSNADTIAKILLASDDAIEKVFYFKAYSDAGGHTWSPNENWVLDDAILGEAPLRKIYDGAPGRASDIIREKQFAVHEVEAMLALAGSLRLPEKQRYSIVQTLRSELLLARMLSSYVAATMYYFRWKEKGSPLDETNARVSLLMWHTEWDSYREEIGQMQLAASPYRDGGMVDFMNRISRELGVSFDPNAGTLQSRVDAEIAKAGLRR